MIQFFNLTRKFDSNTALNNITFRINEGEFVFITGPSGAGKSTLLRMIFGSEKPSGGHLLINNMNLNRIKRSKLDFLRRKIGFVFQDFKLLSKKTVFENIALALEVTGERRSIIQKKTRQIIRLVGLSGKEKVYPPNLSGGEQQRVAIARAIVREPLILLADEPTGNLDSDLTKEIMLLFKHIHKKGTTVVIATHNHELLSHGFARKIFLNKGEIVKDITPEDDN